MRWPQAGHVPQEEVTVLLKATSFLPPSLSFWAQGCYPLGFQAETHPHLGDESLGRYSSPESSSFDRATWSLPTLTGAPLEGSWILAMAVRFQRHGKTVGGDRFVITSLKSQERLIISVHHIISHILQETNYFEFIFPKLKLVLIGINRLNFVNW